MYKIVVITGLLLLCSGFIIAENDQERIVNFDVKLEVQPDGLIIVTENIEVYCAGESIQRGIFRSLPLFKSRVAGVVIPSELKILDILRDGLADDYHLENHGSTTQIYIGNRDYYLPSGLYKYTIRYSVSHQLRHFDDFDEIYWNVTGNYWQFTIENASAELILPDNARILMDKVSFYTGIEGSVDQWAKIVNDQNSSIRIKTTLPLSSYEGFTIAVPFEKGAVSEPDLMASVQSIIFNNPALVFVPALLLFFGYCKMKVGESAPRQIVMMQSSPPAGIGPAFARYLFKLDSDNRAVTATYIHLAIQGFLKIDKKKGEYELSKTGLSDENLPAEERTLAKGLFAAGPQLKLNSAAYNKINQALTDFKLALAEKNGNQYFITNRKYTWMGILSSIIFFPVVVLLHPLGFNVDYMFALLWLGIGLIITNYFLFNSFKLKKERQYKKSLVQLTIGTISMFFLLYAAFITGWVAWDVAFYLWACSVITSYYSRALTIISPLGQQTRAQLLGFKQFLQKAQNEQGLSKDQFEKFLPYAIALDLEKKWAQQFEIQTNNALAEDSTWTYRPIWYHDNSGEAFKPSALTRDISKGFSSSVSSSSSDSSSGSSGGGSSGGGSGGGGGGGW